MKLYYSDTSPYSRKVRLVALEKGIGIEEIKANPFEETPELKAANPLGAVPTFITDKGTSLYDSPVICAWLDSLKTSPALIPQDSLRWDVLRSEALTDGMLDAAFSLVMEGRRPEEQQSSYWKERWTSAILRAADVIENDIEAFRGELTIAHIGLGSALGYLDFRLPHIDWRNGRPLAEAWFSEFSKRPSMQATEPPQV